MQIVNTLLNIFIWKYIQDKAILDIKETNLQEKNTAVSNFRFLINESVIATIISCKDQVNDKIV